jgi:hypothetical protein
MTEKLRAKSKSTAKQPEDKQWPKAFFLFSLLLIGLYLGFAGWTRIYYEALALEAQLSTENVDCSDPDAGMYDGNDLYCTEEVYFAAQQLELMTNAGFLWTFALPDPLHLILSAFAFGLTGSLVTVIRIAAKKKRLPNPSDLSLKVGLGGMTAVMLLGALYLFPLAVSSTNITLKPTLEPFLCLFAGAYSENIQRWFQSIIDKFFSVKKDKS